MLLTTTRTVLLALATLLGAVSLGHSAPVVLTVPGVAQFDPGSTPAPFGIVSGQPITLEVSYDDASIGNGTHRATTANGIQFTFTLGAPGMEVQFTEADDDCFDNPDPFCSELPSITLFNNMLVNINYFGFIMAGGEGYWLSAFDDLAESPTQPGFYFDWLLINGSFTQTLAGGTLAIAEPATTLVFGLGLIALGISRLRRRTQA